MSTVSNTSTAIATIGPLLQFAFDKLAQTRGTDEMYLAAAHMGATVVDKKELLLPVVLKLARRIPEKKEPWEHYKGRINEYLAPTGRLVKEVMGLDPTFLYTANAIKIFGTPEQIFELKNQPGMEVIELDPLLQVATMDDTVKDIGLPDFQRRHPNYDGTGVTVAVLDSGIDLHHPFLQVYDSVSTCGEPVDLPGSHGTHCAGIIASRDSFYPGVAPGVRLLNIKVLQSDGRGLQSSITRGIDAAIDRGAELLSISISFNHLPTWAQGGHGWACPDGRCPLCTAVDNAVAMDNRIAVVAAGNERVVAENLRQNGKGDKFDTELGCPGQAREAITVGAVTKVEFLTAPFSSRGPTAYGDAKPDVCAPGVNITSTDSVPIDSTGKPIPNPDRGSLFVRKSGTSMATPVVSGTIALIMQKFKQNGTEITPENVKKELYLRGIVSLSGQDASEVGRGVTSLKNI